MRDGVLIVNKRPGLTSHDVVQLARRRLGIQRIGHAGTLDPMAQGVLVLLVGGAVRHQRDAQAHRKRYEALIELGTKTDTGDAWGRPVATAPVPVLEEATVSAVLASFIGTMTQVPPAFSAVKVQGRPLYWWARRGTPAPAKPRTIQLFAVELLGLEPGRLRCRIDCSSGTYVRSLAEVIAQRLGTLGHVRELVRVSVGPWHLAEALDMVWLTETDAETVWHRVRPWDVADACHQRT